MLVQNLRNLGQNILLEKRYRDVPLVGGHAHWHTVERAGSVGYTIRYTTALPQRQSRLERPHSVCRVNFYCPTLHGVVLNFFPRGTCHCREGPPHFPIWPQGHARNTLQLLQHLFAGTSARFHPPCDERHDALARGRQLKRDRLPGSPHSTDGRWQSAKPAGPLDHHQSEDQKPATAPARHLDARRSRLPRPRSRARHGCAPLRAGPSCPLRCARRRCDRAGTFRPS